MVNIVNKEVERIPKMKEDARRPVVLYAYLAWFGAAICLASVALIFGVSGSIGIPVCAVGVALVAIALVSQRRPGAGNRA